MQQIRCYFTEGLQDEASLRQARMRNYEVFFVDYPVAVQQKIKIHSARPLMDRSDPFEGLVLDPQQVGQQRAGGKQGREPEYRVVEGILLNCPDRRCFIE